MFFRLLSLLLLSLLAACAAKPALEPQNFPVPADWPVSAEQGQPSVQAHWREFFPDPQLQLLISAALANNRDLRIAAARVQEARAQYGLAKADRMPSVGLTGSGAFVTTPTDLASAGSSGATERYDLGVSLLSYEVDFWGRLSGLSEAAKYSFLASEDARKAVQLTLVADVANAYFSYIQAGEISDSARTTLVLRQQSLDLIGKGKEIGGAYDLEVQLSSGLLENARSTLEGANHQRNLAINRLNFLVGNALPSLPQDGSLSAQGLDVNIVPGLPSDVLLLRPDVMAAEQKLRAAHANIAAARAAFMPKILLTATAGLASQGLAGLFSGAAWAFQPAISLPIFDGGRLSSGVDLAKARKVIAVAEYERTIQQAFREVADLLSARIALSRQLSAAIANRRSQGKLLEIANARYAVGLVSYLDVLDAKREFVASAQMISQVRRAQLESATQLYKALGGGGSV